MGLLVLVRDGRTAYRNPAAFRLTTLPGSVR